MATTHTNEPRVIELAFPHESKNFILFFLQKSNKSVCSGRKVLIQNKSFSLTHIRLSPEQSKELLIHLYNSSL